MYFHSNKIIENRYWLSLSLSLSLYLSLSLVWQFLCVADDDDMMIRRGIEEEDNDDDDDDDDDNDDDDDDDDPYNEKGDNAENKLHLRHVAEYKYHW